MELQPPLDIISCQLDDWGMQWHSRHHLCFEFAKQHRVLIVTPPHYVVDLLHGKERSRRRPSGGLRRIEGNLYEYTPPRTLPATYRSSTLAGWAADARDRRLLRATRRLGFGRPVLYVWHPDFLEMLRIFPDAFVVFHKYDHYAGYLGGSGRMDEREVALLRRADLVIAVTEGLRDLVAEVRRDVLHVPHGVDLERFLDRGSAVGLPDDIEPIRPPRLGYVGLINEKVDFELLTSISRARRDWSIVMIGPENVTQSDAAEALRELKAQENCHFLGLKPMWDVPAYIHALDAGLMCYKVNSWTLYGHPLKMQEYLACGKPVVSTDLPAVRGHRDVVRIVTGTEAWIGAIEDELTSDSEGRIERRIETARSNTWTRRAELITREICVRSGADGVATRSP